MDVDCDLMIDNASCIWPHVSARAATSDCIPLTLSSIGECVLGERGRRDYLTNVCWRSTCMHTAGYGGTKFNICIQLGTVVLNLIQYSEYTVTEYADVTVDLSGLHVHVQCNNSKFRCT
eukprot:SAG11_NODE_2176_length_3717_cov_2.881426_1_plen_119_part_00